MLSDRVRIRKIDKVPLIFEWGYYDIEITSRGETIVFPTLSTTKNETLYITLDNDFSDYFQTLAKLNIFGNTSYEGYHDGIYLYTVNPTDWAKPNKTKMNNAPGTTPDYAFQAEMAWGSYNLYDNPIYTKAGGKLSITVDFFGQIDNYPAPLSFSVRRGSKTGQKLMSFKVIYDI